MDNRSQLHKIGPKDTEFGYLGSFQKIVVFLKSRIVQAKNKANKEYF